MANKGAFKKGHKGFKPKGAVSRTTKEAKEMLEQVMYGQLDKMGLALDRIYDRDPRGYIEACSKLFNYVLPRKTDITSDDKPIADAPKIIIKTRDAGND